MAKFFNSKSKIFLNLLICWYFSFHLTSVAQAADASIIEVRRNITLSEQDPVYKDYYINAGEAAGFKKNMIVFVKRKIAVKDLAGKPYGDIETKIGQLKIIHTESKISVGREYKLIPREQEVMLDQVGIMLGDSVDLKEATVEATKSAQGRQINAVEEPKTEPTTTSSPEVAPGVNQPDSSTDSEDVPEKI